MEIKVGADIVSTKRIKSAYSRFGERFARRILTKNEYHTFRKRKNKIEFLASRFAAKEAVYKAFNIIPFSWQRIEITKMEGEMFVVIDGIKRTDFSISISHEKEYTIATAIHIKKSPEVSGQ